MVSLKEKGVSRIRMDEHPVSLALCPRAVKGCTSHGR